MVIGVRRSESRSAPHKKIKGRTMQEHIIIRDDRGRERTFKNLTKLIKYLDSFKMSFLPDGFTYRITTNKGGK